MNLLELANYHMITHFKDNPCRGIVLGLDLEGYQVQIPWIMGRSPTSQNRVYESVVEDGERIIRTVPADKSKVKGADLRLIIYNAMRSAFTNRDGDDRAVYIIGNGNQTDSVHEAVSLEFDLPVGEGTFPTFFRALNARYCEPDAPNFTPRITGVQDTSYRRLVALSILKADEFAREHWIETQRNCGLKLEDFADKDAYFDAVDKKAGLNRNRFPTTRDEFVRTVKPGFGYCLTTYMSGSKELPPFRGEPLLVPLQGDSLGANMQAFWDVLEPEWRVSLAGIKGGSFFKAPINRFPKVE